jgi:DNA polymerase-3 subunit alpha
MENIPSFCARKNGKEEVSLPAPAAEPVLEETYGIFVYQEQVMQAAQVLGGYSLGGADLLRRAMGKKKAEEMAKHREIFRAGAAAKGIGEEKADEVFDLMEKFAGYGFNKSHAAAYSLLAYHTAWIKVHCTAEFYAANMTIEQDDTDKLKVLLADAKLFGIELRAARRQPRAPTASSPSSDKVVRYGLGAVKGTGQGAIEAIVAAREGRAHTEGGGPFRSLFDFCARVDRKRGQQARGRGADQGRRLRRAARRPRQPAGQRGLAFDWADTQAGQRRCRAGCSTSATRTAAAPRSRPWWPPSPGSMRERLCRRRRRWASTCRATCSTPGATRCGASAGCRSPIWSTAASRSCWPAS